MKSKPGEKIVKKFSLTKKGLQSERGKKIAERLGILYGGTKKETLLYEEYLGRKINYMMAGIVCVLILVLIICFQNKNEEQIKGNEIKRGGYEEGEKTVVLEADSEGMKTELEILIEPRHYTKEQLDAMSEEVYKHLEQIVFLKDGTNENANYIISENLDLPKEVQGYPFSVSWKSSDYDVLDEEGRIQKELVSGSETIEITAKLNCYDYEWEKVYQVKVEPLKKDWEEIFSDEIRKTIEELNETTAENENLQLPVEIDGHTIRYEEKDNNSYLLILLLGVTGLILLWFFEDGRLKKSMEDREKQLQEDYAKLVSKLSLYLGAGLSFRTTIKRIAEGSDHSRYYIKELKLMVRELEIGISEQQVIEHFGKRCRLPNYVKLSVLLSQNLKKGNNSLQKQLREETDRTFEERKIVAKKYGEEAGTKLLFPMVLMLIVVMVMIMYPAFISFTI